MTLKWTWLRHLFKHIVSVCICVCKADLRKASRASWWFNSWLVRGSLSVENVSHWRIPGIFLPVRWCNMSITDLDATTQHSHDPILKLNYTSFTPTISLCFPWPNYTELQKLFLIIQPTHTDLWSLFWLTRYVRPLEGFIWVFDTTLSGERSRDWLMWQTNRKERW